MFGFIKKIWVKGVPPETEALKFYGRGVQETLPGVDLRFVTWNAYKGKGKDFALEIAMVTSNTHVQMLQEASDSLAFTQFLSGAGRVFRLAVDFIGPKNVATGPATGAIADPMAARILRTKNVEKWIKTPKATLMVRYLWGDLMLTVANIHGLWSVSDDQWYEDVSRVFEALATCPGPVVFAGDFNTKGERQLLLSKLAAEWEFEMVDGLESAGAREYDHVLHRGCAVRDVEVLRDIKSSNHFPIRFTVSSL